MNVTNLLNFESMRYQGSQTQAASINEFVANSLRVFIEDFYQRIAPSFILIISCRRPSPANFYRNIMQLLYQSVDTMSLQLINHNHSHPQRIAGPRQNNLILVDSLEALLDIEIHTYTSHHDDNEYYFIFIQQRDELMPQAMQGAFEYCWQHQLINCNVMFQNYAGEVFLYTYFPYGATHCGTVVSQQINRFLGKTWQNRDYFPAKLRNLYKCPLNVLVRPVLPFLSLDMRNRGLEDRLLRELSRRMNFIINYIEVQNETEIWTEPQVLQMLQQQKAHLAIGYIRKRMENTANVTAVFPHYSSRLVAGLLLSAYNLTSFELLTYPFQPFTWLWVLCGFLAVTCFLLCSRRHVDRATIVFSMMAVTWGQPVGEVGSLVGSPRPAHQLLYLNWHCFALLVRCMYSALFYNMLRQHIHQRLPRTLEDLLIGDYTALMNNITAQDVETLLPSVPVSILRTELENHILEHMELLSAERIFSVLSQQTILYVTQRLHKPGTYYILPEHILEQQLAIYLQKHSYLVDQFNELIPSIQGVGLINYWAGQLGSEHFFGNMFLNPDKLLRQPDLWSIYIIIGTLYGIATLVFVWELFSIYS